MSSLILSKLKSLRINKVKKKLNIIIYIVLILIVGLVIFYYGKFKADEVKNCGGEGENRIACNCGDTVMSSYTLEEDLICPANTAGLNIGANSVVLDGNGKSIIGNVDWENGDFSMVGIKNYGSAFTIVKNFANISNFAIGIDVNGGSNIDLNNNQVSNNLYYGIWMQNVQSEIAVDGNNINNNEMVGLRILSSIASEMSENGIFINNNQISNNKGYGISLVDLSSKILFKNNNLLNNGYNFDVGQSFPLQASLDVFNNSIDTTNTVEGKPIYYLVGKSDLIFDNIDAGMFWVINSNNIQISNIELPANNLVSVFFHTVTNSKITNVNITQASLGILLYKSSNNIVENNIINRNKGMTYGIFIEQSNDNTISGNNIGLVQSGINIYNNSTGNNIVGNTITNTRANLSSNELNGTYIPLNDTVNTFTNNISTSTMTDAMISINNIGNSVVPSGQEINLDVTLNNVNGQDCLDCNYTIKTSPPEEISVATQANPNNLVIGFAPTRVGTYSVQIEVEDTNQNKSNRNVRYIVGNTKENIQKLYFRNTVMNHGQISGSDGGSLISTEPESIERTGCLSWIQFAIDEIPPYPLANLVEVKANSWFVGEYDNNYFGIERYESYTGNTDKNVSLPYEQWLSWLTGEIKDINYIMDYPWSWYQVALKYFPDNSLGLVTFPNVEEKNNGNISNAEIKYQYSTSPAIKTITNPDINVLSATADPTTVSDVQLVVDGSGASEIILDEYNQPFLSHKTTINDNNTAKLIVDNVNSQETLESVPLNITPTGGSIDVVLDIWQESGDYNKKWTEEATNSSTSASHAVGQLLSNTKYNLKINDAFVDLFTSDANGVINFNYDSGYSTLTFEVVKATDLEEGEQDMEDETTPTPTPIPTPTKKITPQLPPAPVSNNIPIVPPTTNDQPSQNNDSIYLPPNNYTNPGNVDRNPPAIVPPSNNSSTPPSTLLTDKSKIGLNDGQDANINTEPINKDPKIKSSKKGWVWWLTGCLVVILVALVILNIKKEKTKI